MVSQVAELGHRNDIAVVLLREVHGLPDVVAVAVDHAISAELRDWLTMEHDLPERNDHTPNSGGTVDVDGIKNQPHGCEALF